MKTLQQIEEACDQQIKNTRDYFEAGCLCIRQGKIKKVPAIMSDRTAVDYYEKKCKCSRNYVELVRAAEETDQHEL